MSTGRLPSGTLTFLFTDIEGSTKLGVALGTDRYHEVLEVLEVHTRTLRGAFSDGGIEVRIDGDSLVMVFASAAKAVRAAAAAERGLAAARFPHGASVRVRMGMHTGEGTLGSQDAGADYVGTDIVRAARIAAVAHGGQVLLSDATRAVIGDELPDGVRIRTLGTFRLKDLPTPERIHQLEIQGLPSAFLPLRALDVRRAQLPPEATTFIGRGAELEAVARLLAERHLVTLTGTGGTGKTRLALRTAAGVADRFADGAFFVTLAAITDAELLPAGIASSVCQRLMATRLRTSCASGSPSASCYSCSTTSSRSREPLEWSKRYSARAPVCACWRRAAHLCGSRASRNSLSRHSPYRSGAPNSRPCRRRTRSSCSSTAHASCVPICHRAPKTWW